MGATSNHTEKPYLTVGRFGKPHGLKGWIRVNSSTQEKKTILNYKPWFVELDTEIASLEVTHSTPHGKTLLVHIKGYDTPEDVKDLTGKLIQIHRTHLPQLDKDEFYWADLEGLAVKTLDNVELGSIKSLMEAGACDVMVVKGDRERLIPFDLENVVSKVDLKEGIIWVDWDPEF